MMKQIVLIHGGNPFDTHEEYLLFLKNRPIWFENFRKKDWKETLNEKLGAEFDVIKPQMPCKENAKYAEWKIWFERLIPFFEDEVVFIGHSLGGIFVAKWLSENNYPKKIRATLLIAAPYQINGKGQQFTDFKLTEKLEKFTTQGGNIIICHSEDDPIVNFNDSKMYKKGLPESEVITFKDRKHFNGTDFPEIIQKIKSLY
ncbi:MAG: hypothetical protein AB197_00935 [Parcubacteria bacterium C7867-002]|nr:MAG: hypothetical protein AB197_00935 [Parcubacteria bacterium C7867-002]